MSNMNRLLLPFLVILGSATELHAGPRLEYETTLSIPQELTRPALPISVTTGNCHDEICVTDATTGSGHLFNSRDICVFSTGELASLSAPVDLTVDSLSEFVCTDSRDGAGRTIKRLDMYGNPISFKPEPPQGVWEPEHLLITRDGNYVTTDPSSGLLAKHDAHTGALIWSRALPRQESGEILGLGKPAEAPDGRLYVPLGGDKVVLVLSAQGEYQSSFGVAGTGRGRLSFPVGVAFCPDGSIAVLDRMRAVILLFSAEHDFIAEFGGFGGGARDFYHPVAIAATRDGRVFVAQGFRARVHEFRFSSTVAAAIAIERFRPSGAGRIRAVDPYRGGEGCL
jgi:hypothetical protein